MSGSVVKFPLVPGVPVVRTDRLCAECGLPLSYQGTFRTLVGYGPDEPGHDHDDNCVKRTYFCEHGHARIVSKRNRCPFPGCAWVGKAECGCHSDPKVEEWPEKASAR